MTTKSYSPDQYGKIPYAMVASGAFHRLKRGHLLVYVAIAAHVNRNTWMAYPSVPTIATCTGLSVRQIYRLLSDLEEWELMTVEHGRTGVCNRYTLNRDPRFLPPEHCSGDEKIQVDYPGSNQAVDPVGHGDRMNGHGCHNRRTPLSNSMRERDTQDVTLTEEQRDNTRNRSTGAFAQEHGKKKLRQITRRDLEDTERLMALFVDSVRRGLVSESESGRLAFVAAAEHALRVGRKPCGLFANTVNKQTWHFATQADEDAANRRIKLYLHGESPPPPRETPAPLDLAWQGSA